MFFIWLLGPSERARVVIGLSDIVVDRRLERHERKEHASLEALLGQLGEKALDGVQPRGRNRRKVEGKARVPAELFDHLGMLVGGVGVQDHMDQLADGDLALNGVEERQSRDGRHRWPSAQAASPRGRHSGP